MKRHSAGADSSGSLKKKADGRTPLHLAVEAEGCEVVRELLHDNDQLNQQDQNGWTPLHSACTSGRLDIVELLLQQADCSVSLLSKDGSTPLHYLVRHFPSEASLCNLKEQEKETKDKKGRKQSSELDAAKANYRKICQLTKRLVNKGCDPNAANHNGETALHHAAMRGKVTAIDFLMRKKKWKVDVNRCTTKLNEKSKYYGETCLHFAVRSLSPDTVDILLKYGADPSIKGSNGTVVDVANAQKKNEKIFEVFAKHNLNLTTLTIHNTTTSTTTATTQHSQQQQQPSFVFKTPEELAKEAKEKVEEIREWIQQMHLPEEYVEHLVSDGFDDLNTIKLISETDLQDIGITKTGHRKKILHWAAQHPYISINFVYP